MTFYYGTRAKLGERSRLEPAEGSVTLSADLDAAIWAAELAAGDDPPRVYRVTPTGGVENMAEQQDYVRPPHPSPSWCTDAPVVVVEEVTNWRYFHGTKADLRPGAFIEPGHAANFGPVPRAANFVYFTRTLDASVWGAELASGDGPGRVYVVEPTGPFEDDPNLTNKRFRGNPTKSFRSRAALRVIGEHEAWEGHPPALVRAMQEGIARLEQAGETPDDG